VAGGESGNVRGRGGSTIVKTIINNKNKMTAKLLRASGRTFTFVRHIELHIEKHGELKNVDSRLSCFLVLQFCFYAEPYNHGK